MADRRPFIVGVVADLSGRASASASAAARQVPLHQRRFASVDRDDVEDLMARLRPEVRFEVPDLLRADGGGTLPIALAFESFDDFGPDAVIAKVPALAAAVHERARLAAAPPASMTDAELGRILTRALGGGTGAPSPSPSSSGTGASRASPVRPPSSSFLDQVLDATTSEPAEPPPASPSSSAAPLAALDALLSRQLSLVLHHGDFRALESAWRGLRHLVRHVETDDSTRIRILDAAPSELAAAAAPDDGPIFREVCVEALSGRTPRFSLLVIDHAFGPAAADVEALAVVAAVAHAAEVPVLAGAAPALVGAASWRDLAGADEVALDLPQGARGAFDAFRREPEAAGVFLFLPRLLARRPYDGGAAGAEAFPFVEEATDPALLGWMNPAFAVAAVAARACQAGEPRALHDPDGVGRIAGLPALLPEPDARFATCLKAVFPFARYAQLAAAGLAPLLPAPNDLAAAYVATAPSIMGDFGLADALGRHLG